MNMLSRTRAAFVTLLILALLVVGCSSPTQQLQQAARPAADTPAPAAQLTQPAVPATPGAEVPAVAAEPTATSAPTQIPTPPPAQAQPLRLVDQGFGQDGREVGYAFVVENPNEGLAIESSRYQVALYDADDVVVKTDSGHIELLLPGQTLGLGDTSFLDDGLTVARIDVQIKEGKGVAADPMPGFTVENATYSEGLFMDRVTGLVRNPYTADLENLRVSAVLYDANDGIIGGGFTFLSFILAEQSAGVSISVTGSGTVARVDLYPTVSGLTFLGHARELPAGAEAIRLVKYGYGEDDMSASFGLLVENPGEKHAVESSQYLVTAFAADGRVIGTDDGYISVLLPGETLGIGGSLLGTDDVPIDRIEAHVLPGKYVESEPVPTFTGEGAAYRAGSWSDTVSGQILSAYNVDITNLQVYALVYNAEDEIVGGGFTFLDFSPAGGRAAVEVSVSARGTVARSELYATVSSLSQFD
jgi:hypothetical protein